MSTAGDYEMCFINRYSVLESKKIMWELDVTGEEEELETEASPQLSVNQTLEEYSQQARELRIGIVKVRTRLSKARSSQWWLSSKTPKDTERLEAINQMIDSWSVAYSILVILVEAAAAVEIIDSKNTEDQSGGLATVAGYERQPKIFGLGISDRTTTVSV